MHVPAGLTMYSEEKFRQLTRKLKYAFTYRDVTCLACLIPCIFEAVKQKGGFSMHCLSLLLEVFRHEEEQERFREELCA